MNATDGDMTGLEDGAAFDGTGESRDIHASDKGEMAPILPKEIPPGALILLPVRNTVMYPGVVIPFAIGRKQSIAAAQEAVRGDRTVGIVLQRRSEVDEPGPEDLYEVGTEAAVLRYVTTPDGSHHVICQGKRRFQIVEYLDGYPFPVARVEPIAAAETLTPEVEARLHRLRELASEALELTPDAPAELKSAIHKIQSPGALADLVANFVDLKLEQKQEILESVDVGQRLRRILELLADRIAVLKISAEIGRQTYERLEARQREQLLREQLDTIQQELGEGDEKSVELTELRASIEKAGMPEEINKQALKELKRLERLPEAAGEFSIVRTYLDWLIELPWSISTPDRIDIAEARRILDEDHHGLEKVKRRILEYLAVRKLNPQGRSPILCFVGPPGVGKTSLGQSIARATGRKFARASLGGVHDEAEIRGHRRTYVGALPGNIIQAIHKAGTRNPVFMLDELDKLGAGIHGDPSSALLEVLDPEQNATFRDNYLGVPFDLSGVMFIGTANVLDNIPAPLRDRMEVIEISGYTEDEKLEIARRYLVRRQLTSIGLGNEQCEITDDALRTIIRDYTREAGCRSLEREIGAVLRNVAVRFAEGTVGVVRVEATDVAGILGARRFESEVAMRTSVPGVATGLAWTPVGGDILFIEAARVVGTGKLILTGQLGDVMKESAQAALSLIKARETELVLPADYFEKHDVHIHVPAGAIPKDGPSAGVAMFVALYSLFAGKPVRSDIAMTGEISLRGLVLPVGGIKDKAVAASRAGIATVLLPARNRKDLEEIPEAARGQLRFVWLEHVEDAIMVALRERESKVGDAPLTAMAAKN
jgi:ATP-dependent Lon protease